MTGAHGGHVMTEGMLGQVACYDRCPWRACYDRWHVMTGAHGGHVMTGGML